MWFYITRVKMAAEMAGGTRAKVGRPRKHTEGWSSINKQFAFRMDVYQIEKVSR